MCPTLPKKVGFELAAMRRLPLWLKVGFSVWMLLWVPAYLSFYGPRNFLWLCDLCNFILLIALWAESKLLFSSQIVSVLLLDVLWTIDVGMAFFFGVHPIGGTQYMFNLEIPTHIRLFSLFHVFVPVLLVWSVWRLGYDRRGLLLQTALTWIILPLSFIFSSPEWDINWVWGPFGRPQTLLHPGVYFLLCMLLYPVIVYLPTHGLVLLLMRASHGKA